MIAAVALLFSPRDGAGLGREPNPSWRAGAMFVPGKGIAISVFKSQQGRVQ